MQIIKNLFIRLWYIFRTKTAYVYLKSGSVIVIPNLKSITINSTNEEITSYHFVYITPRENVCAIPLSSIEAIESS